jgi:hypothetical protein
VYWLDRLVEIPPEILIKKPDNTARALELSRTKRLDQSDLHFKALARLRALRETQPDQLKSALCDQVIDEFGVNFTTIREWARDL